MASVIGYGWTAAVLPTKNQEWFYMGFELGFRDRYRGSYRGVIEVVSDPSGSFSAATSISEQFLRKNVKMLTGFTTSHDALLATDVLKKRDQQVLTLYIGPGHSTLAHAGANIYTTGESMHQTAIAMHDFVLQHFPGKRGLVVTNPEAVFSINNRDVLIETQKRKVYSSIQLDFASLQPSGTLPQDVILKIASGKYSFLVMTPYAEECSSVMRQLDELDGDLPIIANSSWTGVELLRRMLSRRNAPTYIISLWVKNGPDSLAFEKRIKKVYGIEANTETSYGYDAGIIVAETLNRANGDFSRLSIIQSFKSNPCFEGTSTGTICFGKNGGHAIRNLYPVKYSVSKGFELVE